MKLFLYLDNLPFCVKQGTGGAVLQGVYSTDRRRLFYYQEGKNSP